MTYSGIIKCWDGYDHSVWRLEKKDLWDMKNFIVQTLVNKEEFLSLSYLFWSQQIDMYHSGLDWNQGQRFKSEASPVAEVVL